MDTRDDAAADAQPATAPQRRLYGRRRGRPLRPAQRRLMEELLPVLQLALPQQGVLPPRALFPRPVAGVWLEAGFGAGEHLAAQAAAHPEIGFLGAEVFENGIARLLTEVEHRKLDNLRLFIDDARLLLAALPVASLDRVFILFPDPWPKERHKKRRLVSRATLDALAGVMADGGELRLATDDPDYAQEMLARTREHPDFACLAQGSQDWPERPADWPMTRYEQKARAAGRPPLFLRLVRRVRGAGGDGV